MVTDNKWIILGRFGRPHGVKGAITIVSFTDPREAIFDYKDWHIEHKKQWSPIKIVSYNVYHNVLIAMLADYADRDLVASLTNSNIAVLQTQLPELPATDYYWHQLIGLNAFDVAGNNIGKIIEILPTGSNDVLVIQGEKRNLVPYFPGESILGVDLAAQKITIQWELDL